MSNFMNVTVTKTELNESSYAKLCRLPLIIHTFFMFPFFPIKNSTGRETQLASSLVTAE